MNVVGKVGSLISQGVYSVATPFHPFGGAVDVIVVEQQDGTYRSTPWYVRFGKFQGVLKGAEKMVRISVNGVEANFHMYLDNSGEAYFVREVIAGQDDSTNGVKSLDKLEDRGEDVGNSNDKNDDESSVSSCRNESAVSNVEELHFSSDDRVSLGRDQIENSELDDESQLIEFAEQQPSREDSIGSTDYRTYYERLDQEEDVVESQGSDSEVVLFSVDGHVLTAPISSEVENTDNLQLCTPQFHLGPGEGPDFNGDNEEFTSGQDTWTADFSDIDASTPFNEDYTNALGKVERRNYVAEAVDRDQETCSVENIEIHTIEHNSSVDAIGSTKREDVFKSCLELTNLHGHVEDAESHDISSLHPEKGFEGNTGDSQENSPSSIPSVEENRDEDELKSENSPVLSSHKFDSPHNKISSFVGNEAEASESNAVAVDDSICLDSDTVSLHSVSNEPEWKDEQFDLTQEAQGLENIQRTSSPRQECSGSEPLEPQTENSDVGITSSVGVGFEISLCGHLLHSGMGLGPAGEAFEAYRITEEEFKISASSIIEEENLIVRYKGKYFPWRKAAPLVLGMAAFGLDLLAETQDAILVELNETPKCSRDTSDLPSTPSGRRWRLWPIPFRRVKTIQHTTSTASTDEVFVDSESGSQNPCTEISPSPNAGKESPRKKLLRTNIPSTEQIASLNLKDGQNMITFSFSTRVLGTQQVDAHIYLWKWNARIVISDVDGTITKSDVLGQFMPLVGKDWTQLGVTRLFSAIKENGYQLLFLSARAIVQAYLTRSFLLNIKQDGKTLPNGPVVISPDGLFPSLYREVIRRAPHEFKIACLEDIKALFPSDYNPFYAGFGNRDTDELSYRKIGIPKGKIFIINPKGEVAISHRIGVKSYTSLHTLVNDMFPPTSMIEQEDFNSWNYWRVPLPNIDL
ncbi:Phosphatidate phosphatase pah1 [Thalictrum thalictroides]|uniref:phosphatidate phosphatase n=1 Tax=Thalictrum thalictroides TaxID=46969 RepID=A0A7J6V5W2_THATH|nr:Phosphatidate phosphatase pah1 [Thalictrum thalictroides]